MWEYALGIKLCHRLPVGVCYLPLCLVLFLFFLSAPHFHSRVFIYLNEWDCGCPLRWTDRLPYRHTLRIISEPERMKDLQQKPVNVFAGCTLRTAGSSRITAHQGYQ